MVYPGGTRSRNSDKGLWNMMDDQRKRKRMESNRESARRSRLRKRQRLDDLMGQVTQLRKGKDQIMVEINVTKQHIVRMEVDNSVLKAQRVELTHRLQSLKGILNCISSEAAAASAMGGRNCMVGDEGFEHEQGLLGEGLLSNSWGKKHPIMAREGMFDY